MKPHDKRWRLGFENQLFALALAGGAPAWIALVVLVWPQPWLIYPKLLLVVGTALLWLGAAWALRSRAAFQLQTIGNVVEGMVAGDFSLRLRRSGEQDLLGRQINSLADTLHRQRLRSEQALRLVDSVVESMDVAVCVFDPAQQLLLANPTALALLQQPREAVLGRSAELLGLAPLLEADTECLHEHVFPGAAGLWRLRRQSYEVDGQPQLQLLFITDLKQVLRNEELQAWRRLLRVLSHEVNNSLGPIASLSATLRKQLPTSGAAGLQDLHEGLAIMQERSEHLAEFIRRYAALARLPEPRKRVFDLADLVQRLPAMLPEAQLQLEFAQTGPLSFFGDPLQIEQLLINLLKNGVEAGGAPLRLLCSAESPQLTVLDQGTGIANPANLFVPFYSTKPEGMGIGLVLCRQIAEAHGGVLSLEPRQDGAGCKALLRFANFQV
ncbi:ATP-binding protein [Pelomonas sp. SE-A7]|uniref:sensor histidine kinase n=1 Tax=Pelomonas sp. SE-A7 TaxID=3054953 RepID=UPI00259CF501|nr:ATP-binding protein [Pelomonas sp. SE-A7]MDM4765516.1 ATP-binding protein [Pelomonas sp. SE-A7]